MNDHRPFSMLVASIYALPDGPAVSGRVDSGTVRVGDSLSLVGHDRSFTIKVVSIQAFKKTLTEATEQSGPVALVLSGVDRDQIRNRDVLRSNG